MKALCAIGLHKWSHRYDFGLYLARWESSRRASPPVVTVWYEEMLVVCGCCGITRPARSRHDKIPEVQPCH